jgi:hypothetical protein
MALIGAWMNGDTAAACLDAGLRGLRDRRFVIAA